MFPRSDINIYYRKSPFEVQLAKQQHQWHIK